MNAFTVDRFFHLVAAATWLGGLVVMGPLVIALRRSGATSEQLRAAARMFSYVTWTAMGVAIATGIGQVMLLHLPWSYSRIQMKLAIVTLTVGLTLVHQRTAGTSSPRALRVMEILLLVCSFGIFAAAVAI